MHAESQPENKFWKTSFGLWLFVFGVAVLLDIIFYPGLKEMVRVWNEREEFSYGYLIPFITAFLIWQKRHVLEQTGFSGSWMGVTIVAVGLALYYVGSFSTITTIIQYALLIVVIGGGLAVMGWQAFRPIFIPVLFLAFMIPLPSFFLNNLSAELQLLSSQVGVGIARAFNISVYLEGNVIDLGVYKLQVVEACSGLRYLFPLMSLAFICAYIFQGAFWKRTVIFLSSIPITVLMNSLRIGVIAVLVEYWGVAQAQGFIHDFEGWAVFMACLGIIFIEIWILARLGKRKMSFHEAFNIALPELITKDTARSQRVLPKQYMIVGLLLVGAAASSFFMTARGEIHPARAEFDTFPMQFGEWNGQRDHIEKIYLDFLKLDDYILADFTSGKEQLVNLYVAYYASQRAGESAHSPRSCIPGDGWQIKSLVSHTIGGMPGRLPFTVNRMIIQKGEAKQLVYYWFQQRGRVITNEYMVKWYLFWDALTKNRTDGALVRLVTPVVSGEETAKVDQHLEDFARSIIGVLPSYVPD